MTDKAIWQAADLKQDDWFFSFPAAGQKELETAIAASRDVEITQLSPDNFPLPTLSTLLQKVADNLDTGVGLALIRGLKIDHLSREDIMRAYFGMGSYIGKARPQNRLGHMIGHVKDLGDDAKDPKTRIYRTNARQRFHVDSSDIVTLLCLKTAKSGGESAVVSSLAIVEYMQTHHPELAETLQQPYIYDRKGEIPEGKHAWYEMPIVSEQNGVRSCYFARDFIESAQARFNDIPRLSEKQLAALDMMETLAEDPQFHINAVLQPGDLQFVNNHVLLHSRGAYEDHAEPENKRHLLRFWLASHRPRPLAPVFEERYGPLDGSRPRGGIFVPGVPMTVPLEAE